MRAWLAGSTGPQKQSTIAILKAVSVFGPFLLTVSLAFATGFPALRGEFVFDDIPTLVENNCHRDLSAIFSLFDPTNTGICSHRAIRFLSFAFDYWLWGDNPLGYHVNNIVLHGAVGGLIYHVLIRLSASSIFAAAAAVLFVCHPITTESVAYISGRRDLLMALFCLLSCFFFFTPNSKGDSRIRHVCRILMAALSFGAALLSHDSAVAFPVVLVLFELARVRSQRLSTQDTMRHFKKSAVLIPLSMMFSFAGMLVFWRLTGGNTSERTALWGDTVGGHIGTILRGHLHYLKQIYFPVEQIADYSPNAFRLSQSFNEPSVYIALGVLFGLFVAVLSMARAWPLIAAGFIAYIVLLLPSSQIVIHHELFAEHRLYLPFAFLLSASLAVLAKLRLPRAVYGVLFLLALAGLSAKTIQRSGDWSSARSLWSKTVSQVPGCARAQSNLGSVLAREGDLAAAMRHFETALAIKPTLCDARMNLGQLLISQGKSKQGIQSMREAVDCRTTPGRINQFGSALLALKQYPEAETVFHKALEAWPDDGDLAYGLGTAAHRMGNLTLAKKAYTRALASRPDWPKLRYRLALVLAEGCHIAAAQNARNEFFERFPARVANVSKIDARIASQKARCR